MFEFLFFRRVKETKRKERKKGGKQGCIADGALTLLSHPVGGRKGKKGSKSKGRKGEKGERGLSQIHAIFSLGMREKRENGRGGGKEGETRRFPSSLFFSSRWKEEGRRREFKLIAKRKKGKRWGKAPFFKLYLFPFLPTGRMWRKGNRESRRPYECSHSLFWCRERGRRVFLKKKRSRTLLPFFSCWQRTEK